MPFDVNRLQEYPTLSGVYLMKNGAHEVLYVGKAKVLRERLSQYFRGQDGRAQIPLLLEQVEVIECVITRSEKEALLLENRLIKRYKPRYNVLLKDDKTELRIVLTQHQYPRLELRRTKESCKETRFASVAFMQPGRAREMFDLTTKLFKIRQCSDSEFARRTRPCILYGIKRCSGPCCGLIEPDHYEKEVQQAIRLLKGEGKAVQASLYDEMEAASSILEFEKAQSIHGTIKMLESFTDRQDAEVVRGAISSDVIGIWAAGGRVAFFLLKYREGRLSDSGSWLILDVVSGVEEAAIEWLLQYYPSVEHELLPSEIILPFPMPTDDLEEALYELVHKRIKLVHPLQGAKKQLVETAQLNAKSVIQRATESAEQKLKLLVDIKTFFSLPVVPKVIDCFDTSHLGGSDHVACCVRFRDGRSDKKAYRTFHSKHATPGDDYGMLSESIARRYRDYKKLGDTFEVLPDLIVVDGGRGQLNTVVATLELLQMAHIPVIAITKEKGRHDKGLTAEKLYLAGGHKAGQLPYQLPYQLPLSHPLLMFFQTIRDEAHRFSIDFQRKKRQKTALQSELDHIPGIGKKRKEQLLKVFGSIVRLKKATLEELQKKGGLQKKTAEMLLGVLSSY